MSASSVSGVGQGSALKAGQKGAEDMFLGVEKLIGTRIILSGQVVLTGGIATVTFPQPLPGVSSDYIVVGNSSIPTGPATAVSFGPVVATGSAGATSFPVYGNTNQPVNWAVVRVSNSTISGFPTDF